MNTKIESDTNQSLISKLEILLWNAKSWIGQFIKSAPTICLNPLQEWKSKELKLNLLYTTHKNVNPKISIYKTMDESKILFDKAAQWLSIKIYELAFWMVIDLGRTYLSVLFLMNILVAKRNSTYSIEMIVPKNCKKSKECLQIFNTTGVSIYALVPKTLW